MEVILSMLPPSVSLSIDKVSITCNDVNREAVEDTCNKLSLTAASGLSEFQLRSGRRHFLQGSFGLNQRNQLLVQAGARHPGIADYRFEFNPNAFDPSGMDRTRQFINDHWGTGIEQLFRNGRITRIDLALDIEGIALEDVVVRSSRARKHAVYTSANGNPETVYLGSGKKNRTVVYGKEEGRYIRIERRLRPMCLGRDLIHLPNPFDKVQIVSTTALLPFLSGMIPQQFFDSVRMRGLTHVIRQFPSPLQKAIRTAFADPANSLMPSMDVLWEAWPDILDWSGLASLFGPAYDQAAE
ncbi:replication initiation factor domain-containing protein [Bradyrhizobium centrosematis]|uniref:replication initiation factor domain-containing protein n=1 Tax=Bradyrhizobium centrosematis TaxID=1300039 RepID=UPI002168656B|nr:replication initiation factor domain-containing protein [Bradyrhizobium centrosematis]MCS3764961.1 hypothetical protein [Bradyrhizobium centrosematis]MCS3777763.1 hypothetical protein [Bradyrhizobium centrosematis]